MKRDFPSVQGRHVREAKETSQLKYQMKVTRLSLAAVVSSVHAAAGFKLGICMPGEMQLRTTT